MHAHDDKVVFQETYIATKTHLKILTIKLSIATNIEFQIKLDVKSQMKVKCLIGF